MLSKLRCSLFSSDSKNESLISSVNEDAVLSPEETRLNAIKQKLNRSINPQGLCDKASNVSNRYYPATLTKIKTGAVAISDLLILSLAGAMIEYEWTHDTDKKGFMTAGGLSILFLYSGIFRRYSPYYDENTQLPVSLSDIEFLQDHGIRIKTDNYYNGTERDKGAADIIVEIVDRMEFLKKSSSPSISLSISCLNSSS